MSKLPSGWARVTLNDVATWASGGTPSRTNPNFFNGSIPWLKTGELGPKTIYATEEHISDTAVMESSAKVFPKGAVAMAMYGATIGKTSILGIKAATNQACAVGIPDATTSEFLYYFLTSQEKIFIDAGKGGAQPNISQNVVKSWPIFLPPFAEQTRIVTKLEELLTDLDAGVAELKAAKKKLAQYRQSLLKSAVEGALTAQWRENNPATESGAQLLERILQERRARWETKQLAKFAEQGKTPPKEWQKKYPEPVQPATTDLPPLPEGWVWATIDQLTIEQRYGSSAKTNEDNNGIAVLRMGNIQEGRLDYSNLKYLPKSHNEFPSLFLKDGDLLFNRTNSPELVGKTAIYRSELTPCSFASYLISVRLAPNIIPEFVSSFINSVYGRHWVKSVAVQQVGQANVNGSKLAALTIPLPPAREQIELIELLMEKIAGTFEQTRNIELSIKQSTAQRQNILRAAFAGQLVPQDPNDEPASVLLERIRAQRTARATVKKARGRRVKEAT